MSLILTLILWLIWIVKVLLWSGIVVFGVVALEYFVLGIAVARVNGGRVRAVILMGAQLWLLGAAAMYGAIWLLRLFERFLGFVRIG